MLLKMIRMSAMLLEFIQSEYNMAMNMVIPSSKELRLEVNGEILEIRCKVISMNRTIFN